MLNKILIIFVLISLPSFSAAAVEVGITRDLQSLLVSHGGKEIRIIRNQDTEAMLAPDFARTSRPCPPFCAQPMKVDARVATIGELELIEFMQTRLKQGSGVLIDARTPDWFERGTIPGSVNIPFNHLNPAQGADDLTLEDALAQLGVVPGENESWNFSGARHLILWCNGPWCGQSPTAIKGLLSIGYPPEKIAYYRGGMQVWLVFGLPVVYPDGRLREE